MCDRVCLVLPPETTWDGSAVDAVVAGGDSHAASARAGFAALPDDADTVVLFAASHPLASPSLARRLLSALVDGVDAVGAAMSLPDALKHTGPPVTTVSRDDLVTVQMPMVFRLATLRPLLAAQHPVAEELELIETAGGSIRFVDGEITNLHLTRPDDLGAADALLEVVDWR